MSQLLKLTISCSIALLFAITGFANETVTITKKLQWLDLQNPSVPNGSQLDFLDSHRDAKYESLPVVVHIVKLKNYATVTDVIWEGAETGNLIGGLISAQELYLINSTFKLEAEITDGAGVPYMVVKILPLRLAAGGLIDRLLSCNIRIELTSAAKPNLRSLTFAEHSALSQGSWYKMSVSKDGIYKIDANLLSQLGIDINSLNPQQINIYGNGGQMLPASNSAARYDDLQKCSIYISSTGDEFLQQDYILFYAKGIDTWKSQSNVALGRNKWIHSKNYYSDSAYYFIRTDDSDPKRIQSINSSAQTATHSVNQFQDYQYQENDYYNLAHSGRQFFGDQFGDNTSGNYIFNFPHIISSLPASLEARVAIRSVGGPSSFNFSIGSNSASTINVTTGTSAIAAVASAPTIVMNFAPSDASININVNFQKYSATADVKGYIDFLRINATRALTMSGNQMTFRDTNNIASGNIGLFQLSTSSPIYNIWDITDFISPGSIQFTSTNTGAEWKQPTEALHEFIAFNNVGFLTPQANGKVNNQDLHALSNVDLVIVTAPALMEAAQSVADIHAAEGMSVVIATPVEIFNEFSSGAPDVTAIRMLMKMLYDRANGDQTLMPKNLLMMGDGDYSSNKGIQAFTGSNMMIYESEESFSPTNSYVSDDYFVFLSDSDDASSSNLLDAGVGRIPASDIVEARGYVDKIRTYIASNTVNNGAASCIGDENQSPFGAWRNIITFIADDQDGNDAPTEIYHLQDSDGLAAMIQNEHPEYDISKIYMDAFQQESTPGGERYPDGEAAIRNRVQDGSLIVAYLGHGGERGFAHERILDINTIKGWTNKYRLPLFLTATCELARYDDPEFNTAGEMMVMNPNGGAIAILTTTRIVFVSSNLEMDQGFFKFALDNDSVPNLTLGKLNMLTKNDVSTGNSSKPNFSLLGDPALKLSYPKYHVYSTHINGQEMALFSDTLKALQEVEFTGYIGDAAGNKLSNFQGFVYPTIFDKQTHVFTLNNDGGVVQEYDVFNKNIFKGKVSVHGGDFKFKFVVPYDINYTVGNGRVSYYSVAGNDDAHGYSQDFKIGSSLSGAQLNKVGPEIELFLNDTTFISGGVSNTTPILIAQLRDENGINTVGNGIGHDLTAILDNNTQNPLILNQYYETNLDTYKSGAVRYQMEDLSTGNHTISLKAWDVHNNSNSSSLDFTVAENGTIALQHVLNYPNPFTTHTAFMFEHNQACTLLDVRVQIFTVSGKLVKTLEQEVHQDGFRSEPIAWNGTDDFGDRIGKGVYVYKIEVRNEDGDRAEQYEKLVILK